MRQAGDGNLSLRRDFHGGLNNLARGVRKLQTAFGQVSWLLHRRFDGDDDLHSGATARDSHPLPYSPRSDAGQPNAFEKNLERGRSG